MLQRLIPIVCLAFLSNWLGVVRAEPPSKVDSLTIQSALERALNEYPTIHQSRRNWEASLARVDLSNTAALPTVDLEAGYTRLGPSSEIVIPHFEPLETYPLDNYDVHVLGRYTVYDFGRAATAVDVSKQKAKSIQPTIEFAQANLAMQTVQSYYSILFYQYSLAAQDSLIDNLTAHQNFTEKQVQTGSATDFDQLTTTVRIDVARTQRTDLENSLRKQEITLRRLLNLSDSERINIAGSFSTSDNESSNYEEDAIASALKHRPELLSAREEEDAAKLQSKLVSLTDKPTVGAMASWGLKNGFEPNLEAIRGNWALGMKVSVPLYSGNATSHREAEAMAQSRIARLKVEEIEKQVSAEVRQCFADLHTTKAKLQTAQKQIDHAQAALDNANARFRSGTIRNIELLDAESALTQMRLLKLQTEYAYTLNEYALEKAIGTKYWLASGK